MEKYFIGGNTAYGFRSFYDGELARCENVILMKGAPGTGKSTLLKTIGKECAVRGIDHELWYCSGDPESVDGIYIKELRAAVVDATAPHPCDAALPVIRERIVDMASAMDRGVLLLRKERIQSLINYKKGCYARAYDKLKCAFCHFRRAEEAYAQRADICAIRREAAAFVLRESGGREYADAGRNAFCRAITPAGKAAFYDYLLGKRVYEIKGTETGARVFLGEAARLLPEAFVLHHPLCPERIDAVVTGDYVITSDAGAFSSAADKIELGDAERGACEVCEEHLTRCADRIKSAVNDLASAKTAHAEIEKIHATAMDFSVTDGIVERVKHMIFGE